MKPYIHIVNYEQNFDSWILTKYAKMMEKELTDLGYDVTVGPIPNPKADINHHINYSSYQITPGKNTMMVTHVTGDKNHSKKYKIDLLKEQLKTAVGICFSKDMKDNLVKAGCPANRLEVILPAHDGYTRRPRIISIATRIYPDGRKREWLLAEVFKKLDPKKFIFRIMGDGWKKTLDPLVKQGIQVQWIKDFEPQLYREMLDTSDYLFYPGDEDALAQCLIDAAQIGLRTIAPPHSSLKIDLPFKDIDELIAIFKKLEENQVEDWTWENYSKKHIKIWEKLCKN